MGTPKVILCPTDFGEATLDALRTAAELAAIACAEVVLVHVVNPMRFTIPCPEHCGLGAVVVAPMLGRSIESAARALRRIAAEVLPQGLAWRARVELGSPESRILEAARSENSDLIVMGTRCRSLWRRVLDPSLAEWVVRHSVCPVLVVRQRKSNESAAGSALAADALTGSPRGELGEAAELAGRDPHADRLAERAEKKSRQAALVSQAPRGGAGNASVDARGA